jgi:hypothetical protein
LEEDGENYGKTDPKHPGDTLATLTTKTGAEKGSSPVEKSFQQKRVILPAKEGPTFAFTTLLQHLTCW